MWCLLRSISGRLSTHKVISTTLSICYRDSNGLRVAIARSVQKGVAWERVQGSGVRVKRWGVTASWTAQEEARVWKAGGWNPLDVNIELRGRWESVWMKGARWPPLWEPQQPNCAYSIWQAIGCSENPRKCVCVFLDQISDTHMRHKLLKK